MLELVQVEKKYKNLKAVDKLSFQVHPGDVFGLLGANGAGKSTTVSMIATLMKPDSGTILYEGSDITKHPETIRKHLGYVPQDIALYESLSGKDNIKFWAGAYHLEKAAFREAYKRVMKIIGFTDDMLDRKVKTYSGGMKRRLNIGVALLHQPSLVIMDEPTAGIDLLSRNQILESILELSVNGTAVLYVGHYMEEIEKICSHICIMDHGRSIASGALKELLLNGGTPLSLEQLYLKCSDSKNR